MGIQHRDNSPSRSSSVEKISAKTKQRNSQINQIGIKLPRILIYVHKGAGKGRGGSKGSKWVDKYGVSKSTNQNSLGKMGTNGRIAKPFINNVLESEKGVDNIATIAAEELGDAIVAKMFIK